MWYVEHCPKCFYALTEELLYVVICAPLSNSPSRTVTLIYTIVRSMDFDGTLPSLSPGIAYGQIKQPCVHGGHLWRVMETTPGSEVLYISISAVWLILVFMLHLYFYCLIKNSVFMNLCCLILSVSMNNHNENQSGRNF